MVNDQWPNFVFLPAKVGKKEFEQHVFRQQFRFHTASSFSKYHASDRERSGDPPRFDSSVARWGFHAARDSDCGSLLSWLFMRPKYVERVWRALEHLGGSVWIRGGEVELPVRPPPLFKSFQPIVAF
jgi:hypothetical protein